MKVYVRAELYFKTISHKKNSLRETNAQGSTYTMRTKRTWKKSRRFHSPFVRDKKKETARERRDTPVVFNQHPIKKGARC